MSDMEDRLTEEVTLLSTKLVTAVSKQLELEEKLFQYHKENHQLKTKLSKVTDYETKFNEVTKKYEALTNNFQETDKARIEAQLENKKLQGEVEDLTASLFDEANKMVSDASRETYNFKIKNRKLYEELDEKDSIISSLQNELIDLKKILESSNNNHNGNSNPVDNQLNFIEEEQSYFNASLFSPRAKSIRYDTENYGEFKDFLKLIIQPTFQFDLTNLKLSKFFKKIWVEEIENSINVPSTNFLNRWQKGKYFWNLVVEGKVTIEPVKGINETLKLDYNPRNSGSDSNLQNPTNDNKTATPTAIEQPCEFCQEYRNDNLEHSRLHIVKLLNPDNSTESISYPICNYCLIKLRNICEFFAKLRLINKNVYKLSLNQSEDDEYQIIKLYLIIIIIRSKIFWSKIGYWDNVNEINVLNIDEIDINHFKLLFNNNYDHDNASVHSNEAVKLTSESKIDHSIDLPIDEDVGEVPHESLEPVNDESKLIKSENIEPQPIDSAIESNTTNKPTLDQENITTESLSKDLNQASLNDEAKVATAKKSKAKKNSKVSNLVSSFEQPIDLTQDSIDKPSDDEFTDTVEELTEKDLKQIIPSTDTEEPTQDSSTETSPQMEDKPSKLTRKNSKSKQFSKKINTDLDDTLQMLQESLNE